MDSALRASKENLAYFEAQKKHLESENDKLKKEAEKNAKKLEGVTASLIRQASEAGQLYGSVTSRDIAQAVSEATKEDIRKTMVYLNTNLKTIGLFPVDIILHPEVKVSVTINIARNDGEAEIQAKTGRALIATSEEVVEEPKAQELVEVAAEAEEENAEASTEE